MKTVNTLKYLALSAALAFGMVSCVDTAPEYEPADKETTAEVYFVPTLPSSYNLKGNEGKLTVPVSRVNTSSATTVNLNVTAPSEFKVPSSVTFDSGSNSASFDITFDPEDLVEETAYNFVITLTNDTTPYGSDTYSFTASIPAAWEVFDKGTLTETWWGEVEEGMTLYYQDVSETLRLFKIEKCFGHDTGPTYDVQDYIFYLNTETNQIYIPLHKMGYTPSNYGVPVYYGDESAFYNWYWGAEKGAGFTEGTDEWFKWCDEFRANYPEDYYPSYDGNGGFDLADQYIVGYPGTSDFVGRYNGGSDWDTFICSSFVRTVDYNDDKHFGASSALYEGTMSSMLFSESTEPEEFDQSLRYDAEYEYDAEKYDPEKDDVITTTYYLADYFGEGKSVAFTAPIPELLEDGSEITDVENDQYSGIMLFGHELYVSVKKGSVSFPESEAEEGDDSEEDLLPIFNITLNVYTKDAEGNTEFKFGTVEEVFTALEYGRDNYTIDDLYGGYLEDYLGTWSMFSTEKGEEYGYEVEIEDDGTDEDGTQWVKITNLSGYNGWNGMVDEIYAYYYNYILYVPGQDLENPVNYQGTDYNVKVYPADPDAGKYYAQGNTVWAGICNDGALAFVNHYNGVNLSGFFYQLEGLGGLTLFGNIYGFPAAGESLNGKIDFYGNFAAGNRIDGSAAKASVKSLGTGRMVKKVQKASSTARRVNTDNCTPAQRNETLVKDVK